MFDAFGLQMVVKNKTTSYETGSLHYFMKQTSITFNQYKLLIFVVCAFMWDVIMMFFQFGITPLCAGRKIAREEKLR